VKVVGAVVLVLAGVLFLAVVALCVLRSRDNSRVNRIWSTLRVSAEPAAAFSPRMVADLPPVAQRYLLHAIKPETPLAERVEIGMSGEIKPAGSWLPFKAKQTLARGRGFVWRAKAKQGFVSMEVTDHYAAGGARVQVALFGLLPLVNASGPDIAKSAAGRLLGESVWLPAAFLPQNGAAWEEVDSSNAKVTLAVNDLATTLTLTVDGEGRLREVVFLRWNDTEKAFVPFGVAVEEERTFGGYTIPSKLRAGWWYGTERYNEFFRATVEQAGFH